MPVLLPSPFLGYRCNLRGCCCGGWGISWTAEDLARLGRFLPPDELRELFEQHLQLVVAEDGEQVLGARLKASADGGRCHLLAPDGRCALQQRAGLAALPHVCIDFPVVPYRMADHVELCFRLTCPAALECIFASRGEVGWAELGPPDEMFASRLARVGPQPELRVGEQSLPAALLVALRDRVVAAFADRSRPTLELLAEVEEGLCRLHSLAEVERFAPRPVTDALPFVRYLLHCVRTHSTEYLLRHLERHARFVDGPPLPPSDARFAAALERWEEGLVRWVEPAEPQLRPYLQRYLWLRFASCFVQVQGELRYAFGEVTHELAQALRCLAALCTLQQRPADPALLRVALGAAAHLFHGHAVPLQARVWYQPDHFQGDAPPPPQVPDELQTVAFEQPGSAWDGGAAEEE